LSKAVDVNEIDLSVPVPLKSSDQVYFNTVVWASFAWSGDLNLNSSGHLIVTYEVRSVGGEIVNAVVKVWFEFMTKVGDVISNIVFVKLTVVFD